MAIVHIKSVPWCPNKEWRSFCADTVSTYDFFSGVGIATMVMVTYYNIYYCVIVAWSLYYFVASFVSIPDLPWNTCGKLVS